MKYSKASIRHYILVLVFLFTYKLSAQDDSSAVSTDILSKQLVYADSQTTMRYQEGKIYYYSLDTNKKLFEKGFQVAYPFFKKAAIVKEKGKYGIIDRKGKFILAPKHTKLELPPYDKEAYIAILDDSITYDLDDGKNQVSYTICEEYAASYYPFTNKAKKMGVKDEEGRVLIPPIYDTIWCATPIVIAKKGEKIGLLEQSGKLRVHFDYDAVTFSNDHDVPSCSAGSIGLRKKGIWYYFDTTGFFLVKSPHKCDSFYVRMGNAIGIFSSDKGENILFIDGTTLTKSYDFISTNGLVGGLENQLFLLNNDGTSTLYYQTNEK